MPLTKIQSETLSLIAGNRGPESHLAGATGIHMSPQAIRYTVNLLWGRTYGVLPRIKNLSMTSFSDSPEMRQSLESFFQKRLRK